MLELMFVYFDMLDSVIICVIEVGGDVVCVFVYVLGDVYCDWCNFDFCYVLNVGCVWCELEDCWM